MSISGGFEKPTAPALGPAKPISPRPIGTHTRPNGSIALLRSGPRGGHTCREAELLDVAGYGLTSKEGVARIRLSDYHCLPGDRMSYRDPVNVVATPEGRTPVMLTVESGGSDDDLVITVFAWDSGSNPVEGVRFHWRCIVPATAHID